MMKLAHCPEFTIPCLHVILAFWLIRSLRKYILSATHIEAHDMNWICRVTTFPDFLHCLHLVEKFHRFVEPQVIAADSEKMEHNWPLEV
jgi:hypothetical protein